MLGSVALGVGFVDHEAGAFGVVQVGLGVVPGQLLFAFTHVIKLLTVGGNGDMVGKGGYGGGGEGIGELDKQYTLRVIQVDIFHLDPPIPHTLLNTNSNPISPISKTLSASPSPSEYPSHLIATVPRIGLHRMIIIVYMFELLGSRITHHHQLFIIE